MKKAKEKVKSTKKIQKHSKKSAWVQDTRRSARERVKIFKQMGTYVLIF